MDFRLILFESIYWGINTLSTLTWSRGMLGMRRSIPGILCYVQKKGTDMNLYHSFYKLFVVKYRMSYLFVIVSLIVTYIAVAILTVYIDNVLTLGTEIPFPNLQYIYGSIRTIFILGGITFIIYQYFTIMKASMKDYYILKALGATNHNIRVLLFIQVMLVIVITVPLGLSTGHYFTDLILNLLDGFILNRGTMELVNSSNTYYILTASLCCIIISFGVYMEIGIRKMPLSDIMSDSSVIWEDD